MDVFDSGYAHELPAQSMDVFDSSYAHELPAQSMDVFDSNYAHELPAPSMDVFDSSYAQTRHKLSKLWFWLHGPMSDSFGPELPAHIVVHLLNVKQGHMQIQRD